MQRNFIDWRQMRGTVILMVLAMVICASLIGGSRYFKGEMDQEFRRNNAVFQSNSNRYLAVDEEEKTIREYYPQFIKLYNYGEIGQERRLDWLEALRSAGVDIKLPSLSYTIESQKAYVPNFAVNMGRYRLFKSDMSLKMQLLHEGDLFDLLHELERNAKGFYRVSNCKLINNVKGRLTDDADAANVSVDCLLEWFTLKLADGTEIKV
jgi:hypothetical protein